MVIVKIRIPYEGATLGTGIVYHAQELNDKIDVLTAAHILFADRDKFQKPIGAVEVDFYSISDKSYRGILVESFNQFYFREKRQRCSCLGILKARGRGNYR